MLFLSLSVHGTASILLLRSCAARLQRHWHHYMHLQASDAIAREEGGALCAQAHLLECMRRFRDNQVVVDAASGACRNLLVMNGAYIGEEVARWVLHPRTLPRYSDEQYNRNPT